MLRCSNESDNNNDSAATVSDAITPLYTMSQLRQSIVTRLQRETPRLCFRI